MRSRFGRGSVTALSPSSADTARATSLRRSISCDPTRTSIVTLSAGQNCDHARSNGARHIVAAEALRCSIVCMGERQMSADAGPKLPNVANAVRRSGEALPAGPGEGILLPGHFPAKLSGDVLAPGNPRRVVFG